MKVLFDQGTPAPLRRELVHHEVSTAFEMGWSMLSNGELLRAAASAFDVLITTDQQLRHQQNLAGLKLAIVVLSTTSWPRIQRHAQTVVAVVDEIRPGEIREVSIPA